MYPARTCQSLPGPARAASPGAFTASSWSRANRNTAGGRSFSCGDCHAAGSFRFEDARCGTCHQSYQPEFVDRHVRTWGRDCRACHDGSDRFSPIRFSHDSTSFRLTGRHARTACGDCHTDTRSLAPFQSAPTDCAGCHRADDTHRGDFGSDCSACHGTDSWENARFDHSFPLDHGDHGRIACRTCHEQPRTWRSYTCYGCHEHTPERIRQKHAEEGVGRNLADCVRCHATGREEEGEEEGEED